MRLYEIEVEQTQEEGDPSTAIPGVSFFKPPIGNYGFGIVNFLTRARDFVHRHLSYRRSTIVVARGSWVYTTPGSQLNKITFGYG